MALQANNPSLAQRLSSIFQNLKTGYSGGAASSSATKGSERELFVKVLLQQVFSPHMRFSSGDVTDSNGSRSGQLDVVLEYPQGFSFPMISDGPRLFLAESVAAVIEVKSNIADQWPEVLSTCNSLTKLSRQFAHDSFREMLSQVEDNKMNFDSEDERKVLISKLQRVIASDKFETNANEKIPMFAVGFEGWKKIETLKSKLLDSKVSGVFVINEKLFAYRKPGRAVESQKGLSSLLMFLHAIEDEFQRRIATTPVHYHYGTTPDDRI